MSVVVLFVQVVLLADELSDGGALPERTRGADDDDDRRLLEAALVGEEDGAGMAESHTVQSEAPPEVPKSDATSSLVLPFDDDGFASSFRDGRIHVEPRDCFEFRNVALDRDALHFYGVARAVADRARSNVRYYRTQGGRSRSEPHFPPFVAHPRERYPPGACAASAVREPALVLMPHRLENNFHLVNSNVLPLWYDVLHADPAYGAAAGNLSVPDPDALDTALHPAVRAAVARPRVLYEFASQRRKAALPLADHLLDLLFPGEGARRDYDASLLGANATATCFARLRYGQGPWQWTSSAGSHAGALRGLVFEFQKFVLAAHGLRVRDEARPASPRVLYVRRGCSGDRRCLANAADLAGAFARRGVAFSSCCDDWAEFGAWMREFARADVVMGMHGAGLANMVFARPGTVMLELTWTPRNYFNKLCHQMAFPYVSVSVRDYKVRPLEGGRGADPGDPEATAQQLQDLADTAVGAWALAQRDRSFMVPAPPRMRVLHGSAAEALEAGRARTAARR